MQSFGCQMWDAAFAIQAIISSNLVHEYGPTLRKAHDFVKASQVKIYVPNLNQCFNLRCCSAWLWLLIFRSEKTHLATSLRCIDTPLKAHGRSQPKTMVGRSLIAQEKGWRWFYSAYWSNTSVSTNTTLFSVFPLQVALLFSQMSPDLVGEKMDKERFYDAVNVILSLQVRINLKDSISSNVKTHNCILFMILCFNSVLLLSFL